jgi:transposase
MMVIRSTRRIGFAWTNVIGAMVSDAPTELLNEFHMAHREELLDYCVWRQHNLILLHLHRRPAEAIIS